MKGKRLYYLLGAIAGLLMLYSMWAAFSQPGVQDLKGNYERIAFYKNENNTGPVQRKYAVTTTDTLWQEMQQYGDYMPHTKYGTTTVYFLSANAPALPTQLQPGSEELAPEFRPYVLARYEKNNMGKVSFLKYPYH